MKQIAFILSLFIFTLSVAPCSDAQTCEVEEQMELGTTHDHSQDAEDACTPFCLCQCCGISFTFPLLKHVDFEKEIPSHFYLFHFSFNYSLDYLNCIWQPPAAC